MDHEQAALLRGSGDVFRDDGDTARALLFYDAAIDLYLRAGDSATAAALCEAVVLLAPNGVRSRCSLAWLAILLSPVEEAARRIAQYAEAAEIAGLATRAWPQLRCMAEECESPAVLEVIADALMHLGDAAHATKVYARIYDRSVPARLYGSVADHSRVVAARLTMAITT